MDKRCLLNQRDTVLDTQQKVKKCCDISSIHLSIDWTFLEL